MILFKLIQRRRKYGVYSIVVVVLLYAINLMMSSHSSQTLSDVPRQSQRSQKLFAAPSVSQQNFSRINESRHYAAPSASQQNLSRINESRYYPAQSVSQQNFSRINESRYYAAPSTSQQNSSGINESRYNADFQLLNDQLTYVYTAYYDDRQEQVKVIIIAELPGNIKTRRFLCILHYHDEDVKADGLVKYLHDNITGRNRVDKYKNGFIKTDSPRHKGAPISISIGMKGSILPMTRILIKPPPEERRTLTHCLSPFVYNYSDISQLITNIEFHRMVGVERTILYLDSQSRDVEEAVQCYLREGVVEVRNFKLEVPGTRLAWYQAHLREEYPSHKWGQWLAYNDCLYSQIKTSKYLIFNDVDEIFLPKKHRTLWELADDLFSQNSNATNQAGDILFQNAFFPTYWNMNKADYPLKHLAMLYDIKPLLFTRKYRTNTRDRLLSKALIRPSVVTEMWLHSATSFTGDQYKHLWLDESVGTSNHYRSSSRNRMNKPITVSSNALAYSNTFMPLIQERYKKCDLRKQIPGSPMS